MKQKVVVTLCDECGKDKPTTLVRIGTEGSLRRLDLCDRCVVPARALLDLAERTRPKRRSVTSMPLVSIEDVIRRRAVKARRPLRGQETGPGATQTSPRSLSANPVFSNGTRADFEGGESYG